MDFFPKTNSTDYIFLRQVFKDLKKNLTFCLNKTHDKKFPKNFWEILFFDWLWWYVRIVFYAWKLSSLRKKNIFKISHNFNNDNIYIKNLREYYKSDFFLNFLVKDAILWKKKLYYYNGKIKKNIKSENFFFYKQDILKKVFLFLLKNFLRFFPIMNYDTIFLKSSFERKFIKKNFGYKFVINSFYYLIANYLNTLIVNLEKKDFKKREIFYDILKKKKIKKEKFQEFLYYRISRDIPSFLLEDFKNYYSKTHDIFKCNKIISSYILYDYNSYIKFWYARQVLNGSKSINIEHGGTFSQKPYYPPGVFDLFLTWSKPKKKKYIQIPFNPILQKYENFVYKNQPIKKNLGVFLRTSSNITYLWNLGTSRDNSFETFEMFRNLKLFLSKDITKNLLFKYKNEFFIKKKVFNPYNQYKKLFGNKCFYNLKNSYKTNQGDFLNKCRIIISVYPETTICETIALGIPTICFFNYSYKHFYKRDLDMIKKFEDVGIFFKCPKKLAFHLNKVWDKPDLWFKSPEVTKVLEIFKNYYLGINKKKEIFYLKDWKKILY